MYTHSNPFVQGGWSGAFSSTIGGDATNPPSIYGALPMTTGPPSAGSKSGATHFQFTNPNPTILNSIVVGPHRDGTIHQLVNISTDDRLAGYTAFRDADGKSIALIEWSGSQPRVEVRGSVAKVLAGEWLQVMMDPRFGRPVRKMDVRGSRFAWCPSGEALLLYPQTPGQNPIAVAKKNGHIINLEMSEQALLSGLLESCIVAITLLLSGRRLE